jgi:Flp pilus assembly protein TadD
MPTTPKPPAAAASPSAEARYNEGIALGASGDWVRAEAAYRDAVQRRPAFPEAWNGLGHALKMQGRFDQSVTAYQHALDLRPEYPQALEYLGETYVAMGKLDEAKALLVRLKPLDPKEAAKLEQAIAKGPSARW